MNDAFVLGQTQTDQMSADNQHQSSIRVVSGCVMGLWVCVCVCPQLDEDHGRNMNSTVCVAAVVLLYNVTFVHTLKGQVTHVTFSLLTLKQHLAERWL